MFDLVAGTREADEAPIAMLQPAGVHQRLRDAPAGDRPAILVTHLQATLAQVLALDTDQPVDRQQSFFEMGLDSLTAMELRTSLEASLGVSLPATVAFDYGTVDALAGFLMKDRLDIQTPAYREATPTAVDAPAPRPIDLMSEDEVAALLEAKLLPAAGG